MGTPLPQVPGVSDPAAAAERAVTDAADLVLGVRETDPAAVWRELDRWNRSEPERLYAAVTALAAMVPTDRGMTGLLAWTEPLAATS